jgi:iron complex transport system ATP-binding protein
MSFRCGTVALEARGLGFSYARPVVHDFSTTLACGTVTGILGPNGCGKTTVLRLLDGILRPDAGEVLIEGQMPLSRISRREIARRIAMVPQNGGLYGSLTVFEFAMQGRSPHLKFMNFETTRDENITLEALERTELRAHMTARVTELSGGEKQRLLLARALVQQARILLLDEFTANLDINYQVELMQLVATTTREQGLATLVVSHEINLLASFSDSIILMTQGKVMKQGRVAEVISGASLGELFGLAFSVRFHQDGTPEILPIVKTGLRE